LAIEDPQITNAAQNSKQGCNDETKAKSGVLIHLGPSALDGAGTAPVSHFAHHSPTGAKSGLLAKHVEYFDDVPKPVSRWPEKHGDEKTPPPVYQLFKISRTC
jgi:hypothetical protein